MAMSMNEIRDRLGGHFPGQAGIELCKVLESILTEATAGTAAITDLSNTVDANGTNITSLGAWATALATKLNADAGVTDTDYDTTPFA